MVSQIAVTLLMLVAAGLFVRTLSNLASMGARAGDGVRVADRGESAQLSMPCAIWFSGRTRACPCPM